MIFALMNYIKKHRFTLFVIITFYFVINLQSTPVTANQCPGNLDSRSQFSGSGQVDKAGSGLNFYSTVKLTGEVQFTLLDGRVFSVHSLRHDGPNGRKVVQTTSGHFASACYVDEFIPPPPG